MQISRTIVGNLSAGFLGRIISALTPILLVPFMIRAWGLDVYGEWLILTAIPAYIMLAPDFGLAGAVVNRMSYLTAGGNEQEAVYIYRSSFVALIIAAGGFVGIGWLIASWVDWSRVGVYSIGTTGATWIIGLSCIQILIAQQSFLLSGLYLSARRNPRLGLLQSISQLVVLVVSLVVLWFDSNPSQFVFARMMTYVLFFLVLFKDSRKIMPRFTLSIHGVSFKLLRPYIVPGFGFAGMPLLHALQNQGMLIVIGSVLGPASVGIFQTARVLSNGVKSVLGLLASSIMVELPALLGEGRKKLVECLLVHNSQIGSLLVIIAITIMTIKGEIIYRVWLGDQVPYPSVIVLLLLVSLLPYIMGQSFTILLLANNQIHRAILPFIVVAVGSIGSVAFGAYLVGLAGAALGVFVLECGTAIIVSVIVSVNNMSIKHYFQKCLNLKLLLKNIGKVVRQVVSQAER